MFVVENHSAAEMRDQMPFTQALAQRYGDATDYRAMTHPSLPNYLAIAGGSTFGVADDKDPSAHPEPGPLGVRRGAPRRADRAGVRRLHAVACYPTSAGEYAVRHNPWTYFPSEHADCAAYDAPMTGLAADVRAGHLPDAGMVVPDVCHDAHDCSLATADAWLRQEVGLAMSGPDFRAGRLAIVVTADEDDGSQGNTVLTVVVHPSQHGDVVSDSVVPSLAEPALHRGARRRPVARGGDGTVDGSGLPPALGPAIGPELPGVRPPGYLVARGVP